MIAGDGLHTDDAASEIMVAYKGKYVKDSEGNEYTCFDKISDDYLGVKLQVSKNENESYELGETLKFSSNIPLRTIDADELPSRFYPGPLSICK